MRRLDALLFFTLLLSVRHSVAVQPDVLISQYGHASWRVQDGEITGVPTAVTQTRDGYIWVATRSGLQRFDGIRFVQFSAPEGDEPLRSPRIISMIAARDGSLWIGTGSDIERWDGHHLAHYPSQRGFLFAKTLHIIEARSGTIWFVRGGSADSNGPLCKIDHEHPVCFGPSQGLPPAASGAVLLEDPSADLWLNAGARLLRWNGTTATPIATALSGKTLADAIETLAFDIDGSLLVGAEQSSRGVGLSRVRDGRLEPYTTPTFDGRKLGVQTLFVDTNHALWIGTLGEGIYRVLGNHVEHFRRSDGLTSDTVNGFFEDLEGNLWVSTSEGLDRFRDLRVVSYSAREGLSFDSVNSVAAAKDGTIWIGNWHSLDRLENGRITSLRPTNGLPGEEVTGLLADHSGRLWVGVDGGLTCLENNRFTPLRRENGSDLGVIYGMSENSHGDIWAMNETDPASILQLHNFKIVREIPRSQLKFAFSKALAADSAEGFWVATHEGNLAHWHDGHYDVVDFGRPAHTAHIYDLTVLADGSVIAASSAGLVGWHRGEALTMTEANGLPCRYVWALQRDARENLWLYAECGLLRLNRNDLDRWLTDQRAFLSFLKLDTSDGVHPSHAGWSPVAALGNDGKLYFANDSVLQVVDPGRLERSVAGPPVHVEGIRADRNGLALGHAIEIPPRTNDVEIDYTAPSFGAPQKVRFRYRLEGHDVDWIDAGTRRQALYSDLKPGSYRFSVSASGPGGDWGAPTDALPIVVKPAFYQTKAFVITCAAVFLGGLWLAYGIRVRQIRAQMQGRLDAALKERERIARDLHDSFFQSIQGLLLRFNTGTAKLAADDPARPIFLEALDNSDVVMREGRELVFELRPDSPRASLHEALDVFAANHGSQSTAIIAIEEEGNPLPLHPMVFEELLRMGREALTNAFQHSGATRISVLIRYGAKELSLLVRDNGAGVDDTVLKAGHRPYHYGLPSMRERTAKLSGDFAIRRTNSWSTEVAVRIPAEVAYVSRRGFWDRWKASVRA